MLKFYKEDDGGGFYSVHVSDKDESELLAMCPSKQKANFLLRILRESLGERVKEMEADQTYTDKTTSAPETQAITQAEEVTNETSLIKLTTNRNGLQLISSNY